MFEYLLGKIKNQNFSTSPFKHIYIDNWLSERHFQEIVNDPSIKVATHHNTEALIKTLQDFDYKAIPFPGCTPDVNKYLEWYNGKKVSFKLDDILEGFGVSFRMMAYKNQLIKELIEYLNSPDFHSVLQEKFDKNRPTTVETAVQKYMDGYEISPHPDIRRKCLTYMVNINPSEQAESLNIHTHYLRFKPKYQSIYKYWQNNSDTDRCWVPWNWCDTVYQQTKNNSIVIFAPNDDTMHAVKADYDHLATQRTQIYGNLWYTDMEKLKTESWKDLEKTI